MSIFFHPDYTVGTGITPVQLYELADYTAGQELKVITFAPCPEDFLFNCNYYITLCAINQ